MSAEISTDAEHSTVRLSGSLTLYDLPQAAGAFEKSLRGLAGDLAVDASALEELDSAGALLLMGLRRNRRITYKLKPEHRALCELVAEAQVDPPPEPRPPSAAREIVESIGKNTLNTLQLLLEMIAFLGQGALTLLAGLRSPKHLRLSAICRHIDETGIRAIPIICLMAFLISVVVAYQSAQQLRPLGAEQYTVNLVGLSVLREMGVLLTAIMVAGRSGSAFAAEIGVMKVREEVDALRVLGISPFEILVMPRVLALLVSLPLLTFIAMIMGLAGGAVICAGLLGIPLEQFVERLRVVTHGKDMFVGLIKAPVFAFLIAIVGCMHGMKVEGSAESVGEHTTTSVVQSIFLVLAADAFFSVLFQQLGI
ncbi:MAG: MlaE family lipid ABC transporter permease subunit [Alphaproteobacteria bacterium]|nr:MlaE family lipid ABC transporter permease subunit [Alphaproteobacteria bacterium]